MSTKRLDILNGSISKQLLSFFYPVFFASVLQQIYNTTDTLIIGNFVGKYAIAAVGGSTGSLFNLFTGFAVGITSGSAVVISQFYGNKNYHQLLKAIQTCVIFNVILGLLFSSIVYCNAEIILTSLGVPLEILPDSVLYLQVIFIGFVSSQLYNTGNSILRAIGDTKKPLIYLGVACSINIVLDLLLVVYFKMGVLGVAVATVIAQTISAFLVLYELITTQSEYKLVANKILFDYHILKKLLIIGVPAGIQSALFSISNLTIQSSVNFLGTDYIASWAAMGKITNTYWLIIGALAVSITTFVAQNFGAKNYIRVKKSIVESIKIASIITIAVSGLIYFTAPYILRIFVNDIDIISIGTKYLRILSPLFILCVFYEILSGALRGIGDSLIPSIISLFGICLIRVIWITVVFNNNPTMANVIYCYPVTWIITTLLYMVYYFVFKPVDKKILVNETIK